MRLLICPNCRFKCTEVFDTSFESVVYECPECGFMAVSSDALDDDDSKVLTSPIVGGF